MRVKRPEEIPSLRRGFRGRHPLLFFLLLGLLLFIANPLKADVRVSPSAQKGVLDLRSWDFKNDGPVTLNGEWEFYWQADLRPESLSRQELPSERSYISVPGIWNGLLSKGATAPGRGFGTYRLKILVGRNQRTFGLRFIDVATAFSAYANGRKVVSVGRPGRSAEESIPQFKPQVVDFSSRSGEIDLIIFVSNFHHSKGGIWEVIQLGDPADLRDRRENRIIFGWFLLGAILLMGLYHLGLSVNRQSDRPSLFFGSFCLIICGPFHGGRPAGLVGPGWNFCGRGGREAGGRGDLPALPEIRG